MLDRLRRMFTPAERPQRPLFEAIVASARQPFWYRNCKVADTPEGRFAMIATLTALVTLRLEAGGAEARQAAVGLAECFIDEMDGEVRQMGLGDPSIAKQVGAMVAALGGRIGRLRSVASADGGGQDWHQAVVDSLYHGVAPDAAAAIEASAALHAYQAALDCADERSVITGSWQ